MKKHLFALAITALLFSTQSCKKDEDAKKVYDIPTSYNFDNVDYSGQSIRLQMITELVAEVRKANTAGVTLNATNIKNMYANIGGLFSHDSLDNSGKQLKDKTFPADRITIEDFIDGAAVTSASGATGQSGTAGRVANGSSFVMLDANGFEYKEAVEKHLQGALVYYQITSVYLAEDKVGPQVALADRQHHWDEAFGYFGVPKAYPADISVLFHVGKYAKDRDALLGNATAVVNAFIKGRAAINNSDNETVTEQIAIIRKEVERGVAGTAVHYINGSLNDISGTNQGSFMHQISEGYFLIKSLKYNPAKKATDAQITELLGYFGSNMYSVSEVNLKKAKDLLSTIYGFDAVKDAL